MRIPVLPTDENIVKALMRGYSSSLTSLSLSQNAVHRKLRRARIRGTDRKERCTEAEAVTYIEGLVGRVINYESSRGERNVRVVRDTLRKKIRYSFLETDPNYHLGK